MTITSGLAGVGKTHLSINIALELVRRGRQAGIFYVRESTDAIESLLQVQQPVTMLRRAGDSAERGLLRSGYQGIDIVTCGTPLREWPTVQPEQRTRCIKEMDVQGGYDDFLIDTSGMDARTLLACCRASGVVVLVVTPDPQSRAEAFALLRLLQLNGFTGQLRLLVNKVRYLVDVNDIYNEIQNLVHDHLGLDIALLGAITQDKSVMAAQRARQAFSSMFPDSDAAGGIVVVVDALDEVPLQFYSGPRTLPALWQALIDVIQLPVKLSGGTTLEDETVTSQAADHALFQPVNGQESEAGLLDFRGNLETLRTLQDRLQGNMQMLLADINAFAGSAGQDSSVSAGTHDAPRQRQRIINLVSQLLVLLESAYPMLSFQFQIKDTVVTQPDTAWLRPGRYLHYSFQMLQSELPESARTLLANVAEITLITGVDGELIYELIDTAHACSLSIISDPQKGLRLQAWLNSDAVRKVDVLSFQDKQQPAG